jgi:hypothetical protein
MIPAAAQLVAKVSYLLIALCLPVIGGQQTLCFRPTESRGSSAAVTRGIRSPSGSHPGASCLSAWVCVHGRVSNSCHKGTEKPLRISPRSQLLICLGMCCMVGSSTAVTREIRSPSGSHPGASCSSAWVCILWWDLQQLSQGESEASVDLTQEPTAHLPGCVMYGRQGCE